MNIEQDFDEIKKHAHFWNWGSDWSIVQQVYKEFPDSYSILTPFAYAYLEEIIRSNTSEYGIEIHDESGQAKRRKVGKKLLNLAIKENNFSDSKFVILLERIKSYYKPSSPIDSGDNRNSVVHGYTHSRFWSKDSFENLIHDIALLSKYAGF